MTPIIKIPIIYYQFFTPVYNYTSNLSLFLDNETQFGKDQKTFYNHDVMELYEVKWENFWLHCS